MFLTLLLLLVVLAPVPAAAKPDPLGHGYLGVRATAKSGEPDLSLGEVVPGTPAARAGLKVGDTFVRVGRLQPRHFDDVREYVSGLRPGTRLDVEVRRSGKMVRLVLEVGAAPSTITVYDPLDPTGLQRRLPVIPPNR